MVEYHLTNKSILHSSFRDIGPRNLRAYGEQFWYGEHFLAHYLGINTFQGLNILEVGTAEAGLLKFFKELGANCYGIELSPVRYENSLILNNKEKMNLVFGDICNVNTFEKKVHVKMDVIILRDVIEHIEEKNLAMKVVYDLLSGNGIVFVSFPPKYSPYSGHQQVIRKKWGKLPYIYLLPDPLYKVYLKFIEQPEKSINYFLVTKQRRISIDQMEKIIVDIGFKIKKKDLYVFRPCYEYRFRLRQIKNPFHAIPFFRELFTNGALYLLKK